MPWANTPEDRGQEAQAWFNVMLPWMQAGMQGQQWAGEFDWRKAMDQWNQMFQQQQFDWQQGVDVWAQGLQEEELAQRETLANIQSFGRRWRPNTRWM